LRTTPCRLSATVYLTYSQPPSKSEGRLLYPQPGDALRRGDTGFTKYKLFFLSLGNEVGKIKYSECTTNECILICGQISFL